MFRTGTISVFSEAVSFFFPIFRAFLAVSYAEQTIENFYHVRSVYFTTFQ